MLGAKYSVVVMNWCVEMAIGLHSNNYKGTCCDLWSVAGTVVL